MTVSASVIVNTLNRGGYLRDALLAISRLNHSNFELIVVNGPSTDDTEAVLADWADRIKIARCPEPNLSHSRNIGIEAAAGEVICFLDDDAAPHPDWLNVLTGAYADSAVGAVGGFTIDNTGVRWQVRKTLCDRFGNAYNVGPTFDETPFCFPGSPHYPSLLGTNSSFRASALRAIGGFDHAFAYLLDETDVCLRLVDSGWKVRYASEALVFHQFAESHIRSPQRIAKTLFPSAVSKGYFIARHGTPTLPETAAEETQRYLSDLRASNAWLADHGLISPEHRFSLDEDAARGIAEGRKRAMQSAEKASGDLKHGSPLPFQRFPRSEGMRIVFVSQGFPPVHEAGIARWTSLAVKSLAERGHQIHVITRTPTTEESVRFVDGYWLHRLKPEGLDSDAVAETYDIPSDLARWAVRVRREVDALRAFGVQVVSWPIWDLEGIALLGRDGLGAAVSLHTTYAIAKPFKPEWSVRPLYQHHFVRKVIEAEAEVLRQAPVLLSNSRAILDEIKEAYGLDVTAKSRIVPHATPDPLPGRSDIFRRRAERRLDGPLTVLFAGRFEARKGFDLAAAVATAVLAETPDVNFRFVGDELNGATRKWLATLGLELLIDHPRVNFEGVLSRTALDDAFVDADLVLLPSRFESFGLVSIEALAAGTPVLGLAAGGLMEIVTTRDCGRLWPETADVAAAMAREVLDLRRDRLRLEALSVGARRRYEEAYTLDHMGVALEQFYRQLSPAAAMA